MRIGMAAMALSLLSVSVLAQTTEPTTGRGRLKAGCSGDVQKFCASAPRGKGQIRACLESHQTELSDSCKAAMAAPSKN